MEREMAVEKAVCQILTQPFWILNRLNSVKKGLTDQQMKYANSKKLHGA